MNSNPLADLVALGQSPWLDSISREWLDSGELRDLIAELSITGVTSNPTIFAAALKSTSYDADMAGMLEEGLDDRTIFERLAVDDIRRACDLLLATHTATGGRDGHVSIEVEPDIADDTAATVERAHHLWGAVDRPNLMIKIPATDAGLPAIEQVLADGINVNVTLLFAVGVYCEVMARYLAALEQRAGRGESLQVASVASFFVSRVDAKVDPLLAADGSPRATALLGTVANANAHAAWEAHLEVFGPGNPRWVTLEGAGARPQRPLWASTGTKNPAYSDILYAQELIAPGTVNTMPLVTLRAFADHGRAEITMQDTAPAQATLRELREVGVDLDAITGTLRSEGVASFEASFLELLEGIAAKRGQLATT